jgi:hypothetical protein
MSEQLPPDESRFLANVYNSPDDTVGEVGSRPLPPQEMIKRRPGPSTTKFSAVSRIVIDQALMDYALDKADGDRTRLVPRPDGSVIVANNREQARRALRDPTFGAIGPLAQPNPPEEPGP